MSVERRYSKRLPVNFPAQIHYRQLRPFPGRARNVSAEGACIETHNLNIPTGTLVDLEFLAHGRHWRIAALVVQVDSHGIGLMFREPQSDLYGAFSQPHTHTQIGAPSSPAKSRLSAKP